jgi:hypothetical protein
MSVQFVQQKTGTSASGTSLVVTLDTAATVGNTLIATFSGDTGVPTGISGGGTWTQSKQQSVYNFAEIWVCPVDTGSVTQITFTLSGSCNSIANVSEYSGLQASPQDTTNGNSGVDTANITTGSVTPTVSPNLIVACGRVNTTIGTSPINSWNGLTEATVSGETLASAYLIQTSTTSASTGWTDGNSAFGWDAAISAFKGTAAAGPTTNAPAGLATGRVP